MARNAALKLVDEDAEKPLYADPADVASFADKLPERYLLCRDMGHNWLPFGTPGRYKDGGFERILRCSRCKCERHTSISNTGMILSSHYTHPEGYLLEGLGRIVGEGRGILRLASINRAMSKAGPKLVEDKPEKTTRRPVKKTAGTKPVKSKPAATAAKKPAVKKAVAKKTTATRGRK